MRQLLLSMSPPTNEPNSITKYQPILLNTQFEYASRYGNRIGSAANQIYYYDGKKGEKDNTSDGSTADLLLIMKMNDKGDAEKEITLMSDMERETNTTVEALNDLTGDDGDEIVDAKESTAAH